MPSEAEVGLLLFTVALATTRPKGTMTPKCQLLPPWPRHYHILLRLKYPFSWWVSNFIPLLGVLSIPRAKGMTLKFILCHMLALFKSPSTPHSVLRSPIPSFHQLYSSQTGPIGQNNSLAITPGPPPIPMPKMANLPICTHILEKKKASIRVAVKFLYIPIILALEKAKAGGS